MTSESGDAVALPREVRASMQLARRKGGVQPFAARTTGRSSSVTALRECGTQPRFGATRYRASSFSPRRISTSVVAPSPASRAAAATAALAWSWG